MSSNVITFYDIPSSMPGSAWSPNTWKARYCLNYKGLAYKTVWLEYPEIGPVLEAAGFPPTTKFPDGSPRYTLPAIYDPSTGKSIADSILIAKYLDETYPDTPQIFPTGTQESQLALADAIIPTLNGYWPFVFSATVPRLSEPSQEFYQRKIIEPIFGMTVAELAPKPDNRDALWQTFKKDFGTVDGWFKEEGPFVLGKTASFIDFVIAAYAGWIRKAYGEDSAEWKDLKSWYGGRVDTLFKGIEKYYVVV